MPPYIEERERDYQSSIVELFREGLGYAYLGNLQYARNAQVNEDGVANSPIIESELKAYLKGAGYTEMQVNGAVERLKRESWLNDKKFTSLRALNNKVYELLISGVSIKPTPEENERDVMFFDFKNPENNRFAIAEEVSFIDRLTGVNSRPDIVVYVNGIAIAVIELKRSIVSLDQGIRQNLSNEQDCIPSFFTTTQFTVAARHAEHKEVKQGEAIEDGWYGFKYGTIGTPIHHWCPWKKDGNKTGIVLSDIECFKDFFNKENFMFLFRYGVLSDGGIKKVMRPHQYHALRAAEPRLRTKDSGVIWHSQGSGKSLTMVWLASYIKDNFKNPRVLVITDRTELDAQLSRDFTDTGNDLHRATSQDDLLETLNGGAEWLICTLIHKFGNVATSEDPDKANRTITIPLEEYLDKLRATIKSKYPNGFTVKGENIFIFIDECHRTQGGRLHDAMKSIMGKEVMLIGFTGTPLLKDEKKNGYDAFRNVSELKFGAFIHKYLHKQAVEDKVILDLQYEAQEVEQFITSKEQLDKQLETLTEGLTEERKRLIEERWATQQRVYSSRERIERIGYKILDDMEHHPILCQDWANAMLVAGNIYSAYKYYEFFQADSSPIHDRVAVVTSYDPHIGDIRKNSTDISKQTEEKYKHDMALKSFKNARVENVAEYETWAKKLFVNQPGLMKLVIVVDKLLTGFDAPCATVLYIDKEMRDHALFQAICRVNRLGVDVKNKEGHTIPSHKQFGLIVDFKHLFGKIESAVTRFNDENGGFGGLEGSDIDGLLDDNIAKNKKRLDAARSAFESLKAKWQNQGLTNNDLLVDFYIKDFENNPADARRDALYAITGAVVSSYENLADVMPRAGFSKEEADEVEKLAREASHINLYIKQRSGDAFDTRRYDPDMRALLDRYLRADDAKTIVSATADFSFLDLINDKSDVNEIVENARKQAKNDKAAAEVIEAKARAVINNSRTRDPELYRTFSARLQKILDDIHASSVSFAEQMTRLIQLIKDAKSGGTGFPEKIDTPLKKALWNNREKCGLSADDEAAIAQVETIQDLVEHDASPNYRDQTSADGILFKRALHREFSHLSKEQLQQLYLMIAGNS